MGGHLWGSMGQGGPIEHFKGVCGSGGVPGGVVYRGGPLGGPMGGAFKGVYGSGGTPVHRAFLGGSVGQGGPREGSMGVIWGGGH